MNVEQAQGGLFSTTRVEPNPVLQDEATGLYYRDGTHDLAIIRGDAAGYARRLPLEPGERVLDIGGHIGAAAYWFGQARAAHVVSVEPEPRNYALLERNLQPGHVALWAAVVGDDRSQATLWCPRKATSTVFHSLTAHKGRVSLEVPAVNVTDLIEQHEITYLKVDCEGGEYAILEQPVPASVRRLVVEFHGWNHPAWGPFIAPTIARLREAGFEPDRAPERPTRKTWNWTVAWRR